MVQRNSRASSIVQRLWNYCNILRDDGISYSDYVEQLTYLLFLKMAGEQKQVEKEAIPPEYNWSSLLAREGNELMKHYRRILDTLGQGSGLISVIFGKAQNRIQDPAKLRYLIESIDAETWTSLGIDVKGEIYEGLLEKNAQDIKSGAGQYFTPRPLIQAIVDVMCPQPRQTICDPACGTGGFLIAAHDFIAKNYSDQMNSEEWYHLNHNGLYGWEIVDNTARLCMMNLYLHGIRAEGSKIPITVGDSLVSTPGTRFDMVLTNPPFGKKSSVTYVAEDSENYNGSKAVKRDDFWTSTNNKQLNFLQHVYTLLKLNGRAAIVIPDNVLFEGGPGEEIRRRLLEECDVHTLLRLPKGIFYAHGVNANVLFFDRKESDATASTTKLWVYDLRTNQRFTLKQNPLTRAALDDFVACYNPPDRHDRIPTWSENNPQGRWRAFTYDELLARDKVNLNIAWLRDESLEETASLLDPDMLAAEIIEDLEAVLEQFRSIVEDLNG